MRYSVDVGNPMSRRGANPMGRAESRSPEGGASRALRQSLSLATADMEAAQGSLKIEELPDSPGPGQEAFGAASMGPSGAEDAAPASSSGKGKPLTMAAALTPLRNLAGGASWRKLAMLGAFGLLVLVSLVGMGSSGVDAGPAPTAATPLAAAMGRSEEGAALEGLLPACASEAKARDAIETHCKMVCFRMVQDKKLSINQAAAEDAGGFSACSSLCGELTGPGVA